MRSFVRHIGLHMEAFGAFSKSGTVVWLQVDGNLLVGTAELASATEGRTGTVKEKDTYY